MKNKILALMLLCVMIVATLAGCDSIKLSDNPNIKDLVVSNGGMVVQKGDYLYFTNGYLEASSLKNGDNKYGNVEYSAIYRAKTNNGELIYDVTEDENGNEVKTLKNVELVIPKVVGADTCDFFIFDDYIYYASPTTEKDKTGNSRFDYITIFSAKIDGSNVKKLYSVDSYSTSAKLNIINIDDTIYVEIYDGSKIIILTINNNKVTDTKKISEDTQVTSVLMPKVESYNPVNNMITDAEQYIYYTREVAEDELYSNCNVLCKVKVTDGNEIIMRADNTYKYTFVGYYNEVMYYTISDKNGYVSPSNLFATPVELMTNNIEIKDYIISYIDGSAYNIVEGSYIGAIVTLDNKLYLVKKDSSDATIIYNGEVTILKVTENDIFAYTSSKEIIKINIETKSVQAISTSEDELYFDAKPNFEIIGDYVYCFNTYVGEETKTGYYINRFNLSDTEPTNELLGVITDEHKKA